MSNKQSQRAAQAAADARRARQRKWTAVVSVIALVGLLAAVVIPLLTSNNNTAADAGAGTDSTAPSQQEPAQDGANEPSQPGDEIAEEDAITTDDSAAASLTAPAPELAEDRTWTSVISTNQGDITVELDGAAAPQAVASFITLAGEGFFDGTDCHRLVTAGIYVLQCGDPDGNGMGGPGYRYGPIENAPEDDMYPAGTLAMARVGNDGDSMGSQFFIVYEDSRIPSDTAGGYTVFGQVTEGLSIVEDVASAGTITGQPDGRPAQSVIVNEVSAT